MTHLTWTWSPAICNRYGMCAANITRLLFVRSLNIAVKLDAVVLLCFSKHSVGRQWWWCGDHKPPENMLVADLLARIILISNNQWTKQNFISWFVFWESGSYNWCVSLVTNNAMAFSEFFRLAFFNQFWMKMDFSEIVSLKVTDHGTNYIM